MKKIVFCGKDFIKKNKRGVSRYTYELICALDKYITNEHVEVIVPYNNGNLPKLKNIKFVSFGGNILKKGWQYTFFQYYIMKSNIINVSLSGSVAPLLNTDIVVIHDMLVKNNLDVLKNNIPNNFTKYLKAKFGTILSKWLIRRANCLITVSQFSKKEILDFSNCKKNINVIYNGWEHLKRIQIDDNVLWKKYNMLAEKKYFFYVGAQDRNKNIQWIFEIASRNPKELFVIAGPPIDKNDIGFKNLKYTSNMLYIGYIPDEDVAFLMKHCKAFLFPSIYEGFGIPPLEALYFGAKVLCSNSSCLPEVYKNCVIYIDPYNYNININELLQQKVTPPNILFKEYSWDKSAIKLLDILHKYSRNNMRKHI